MHFNRSVANTVRYSVLVMGLGLLLVACSSMGQGCDPAPPHSSAITTKPSLQCTSHLQRVVVDSKEYRLTCAVRGPAGASGYQVTGVALPQHNPPLHFTWCAGMLLHGTATCQATFTIIVPFAPATLVVTARFTPGEQTIQTAIPVNG